MLTKFSALLTAAAVTAALAGRLAARRAGAPGVYLRTLGCMLLAGFLVCGWHYARVAARFHRPLVGNWERAGGFAWWQDPGYHTSLDFLRFGESLRAPLLAAFHSVPDALYSTLWGDGLLGGSGLLAARPPWNYGVMAAGYLLALLPTAALAIGLCGAVARLVRQPRAEELLLAGVLGATALAILGLSLSIASYAQPKAFYGLSALVPLCALAGWGLDWMAGAGRRAGGAQGQGGIGSAEGGGGTGSAEGSGGTGSAEGGAGTGSAGSGAGTGGVGRLRAALVYLLLAVWACNAYASYWMRHADPGPRAAAAAALDPSGLLARASAAGASAAPLAALRRITAAEPDHPFAWEVLGEALERQATPTTPTTAAAAAAAWREALRVNAHSGKAHLHLGRLLELSGHPQEALYHLHLAARLQGLDPDRGAAAPGGPGASSAAAAPPDRTRR